ncbi:hybrid sensor histidine kinase/response regulator [Pyxidicoccus sp. MSG2]|uniref:hybrid sensor histidine kinase/response regulator n=1 Tax=Pyxidicoccus sp. MSG2 TaxID=2996790 RepID=UPI00226EA918|nr:hybrid sensor histidine kinase/response regulator [Pyxidicoccus sp. MSG2]MCY1015103.1 ATP-binding protein [Pyxidicoccus sp. MSG2]
MHATLVAVPSAVAEEIERGLRESDVGRACHVLRVSEAPAPGSMTEGLLVAWDDGGPLEEVAAWCQRLDESRVASRTQFVVLTPRAPAESEALARAGADECVAPPGTHWGARLVSLQRRMQAERANVEIQSTRRAADFLRSALDGVPDPLFVKDRQHRWVAVNNAFCQFMGHSAEELLGRSDYDFVPAHEADVFWRKDEQVFRSGRTDENEEAFTDREGRTHTLVTKKAAFTGTDGEGFLVAVIRDVTDRKRLESQLMVAERMASVGTLAAGVAHEINNPLAFVCSNLSFLKERLAQAALSPEALPELREVVEEAEVGAARVGAIVRDLRTFARADEDRLSPVDVSRVVDGALRLVRNELSHRARLVCTLQPVPRVHGNDVRLSQVVVNLLVNALQALPERPADENEVRVSLRAGRPGQVELEVADNGHGMPPEVQRRIFDPFFTTKAVGEGTGLGLSICLTLVQAMGGRIDVSSTPGRGSSFRVVLPATVSDAAAPVASTSVRPRAPRPVMPRRRLLLIDDEPSVGSSVSRLVRDVYEVRAVQGAREALQLLSEGERFDAILCDLMMPGMSGMDFVVELERMAPDLVLRTGLMTGGAFTPQAREFVGRHSRGLLEKPFEREGLCTFVEHLLQ